MPIQRSVTLRYDCDKCGKQTNFFSSDPYWKEFYERLGWAIIGGLLYCPSCHRYLEEKRNNDQA